MTRLAVVAALGVALMACGKGKPAPGASTGAEAAPAGYVDIGVPECDQFARKYLACIEKVPETTRAMVRQEFEQTQQTWAMAAEKPDRRASLGAACAQQEKATKAGMARYDCEW